MSHGSFGQPGTRYPILPKKDKHDEGEPPPQSRDSCEQCERSKIKCSMDQPACALCQKFKEDCCYSSKTYNIPIEMIKVSNAWF